MRLILQTKRRSWLPLFPALAIGLLLTGCGDKGPATGLVTGLVTLENQPLPNAEIVFYPDHGRASSGLTDADGRYELQFTYDKMGCLPGHHEVMITTRVLSSDDPGAKRLAEKVPRKYRRRGTLVANVEP
ncbi:MAG: carboxypeptidase-like regulatory domain-containing protein, partial [Blastopirellula sp. JB062]